MTNENVEPPQPKWYTTSLEIGKGLLRFLGWFIERVAIPVAPLAIVRLIDQLMGFKSVGFRDEKILIYAFLLPLLYVQEIPHGIIRVVVAVASGLGLLLFGLSYGYRQLPNPPDLSKIYDLGFWLCVTYVVLASIYEIVKIFRPRPVS